ncbi:MAG: Si-specific NAD(P)(+) transhydrogenase, partial [Litorivicinus sp.]
IGEPRYFKYPNVLDAARRVIDKQVALRTKFYARNRVKVIHGQARFQDTNTLLIQDDGGVETVTAAEIVVATGSRPYQPADVDFDHPRVYNSDSILSMSHTPRTLIIYGAGVIGTEYASIFNGLGVKVDLIDTRDRLLSFLDAEISDALSYHLRERGVLIRHDEEYASVETTDGSVTMHLKSGKRVKADALLWCNGRTGNTDNLSLENIGLSANSRGQLEVDQTYRTEVEGVFAVGDVIGWPSLASASYDQGRNVASTLLDQADTRFVDEVPTGIYTIPEISSLGMTEKELTEAKVPYEVGQSFFKDLARAQITGEAVGMLKILFHRDSLEILGIHCFGDQASEIVHIGQAIMKQSGEANTLNYFVHTTFNYPTMAEAYRVAALNGLNRLL